MWKRRDSQEQTIYRYMQTIYFIFFAELLITYLNLFQMWMNVWTYSVSTMGHVWMLRARTSVSVSLDLLEHSVAKVS